MFNDKCKTMKAILLGTDFMYNQKGELVPIQINTAVSHNNNDRVEDDDYIFDLSQVKELILKHNFETIFYIGNIIPFKNRLSDLCIELDKSLSFYKLSPPSLTVPLIQDRDTSLIIRSAYDTSAIVDDSYCRNRVEFLNLIQETKFATEFAYVNSDGALINNINTIPDNGGLPNFIIKSTYPSYDRSIYPKLYRLNDYRELSVLLFDLSHSYFCTPFYYNSDNLYNNSIKNIRSLNILLSPNLVSIPVGAYTKITEEPIPGDLIVNVEKRELFLTTDDNNEINDSKIYINEKIIKDSEIIEMNNILTKIGNQIITKNS